MMRRSLAGPYSAHRLGAGVWQLRSGDPDGPEVFLRGALVDLEDAHIDALDLEWRAGDVQVSISGNGQGSRSFAAESAMVHEPRTHLYEVLPLAAFDATAKRFWNRVFRLIRIPGGRFFLKYLARRNRGRRNG